MDANGVGGTAGLVRYSVVGYTLIFNPYLNNKYDIRKSS